MRDVLAAGARAALRALARGKSLLVFDFDGTLAPLVDDPDRAALRPATRRLLQSVARLYPSAVVSGRALGDLLPRVEEVPLWAILGNHGSEPAGRRGARPSRAVRAWRRALERRLGALPGVRIEDKRYTLTVHYRDAARSSTAVRIAVRAARSLAGARLLDSPFGINVIPATAPHKGTAVARLRRRARCDIALYVGDDESDELAFAQDGGRSLLGVRIGRSRRSRAAYYLREQAEIDRLLETLVRLRSPGRLAGSGRRGRGRS